MYYDHIKTTAEVQRLATGEVQCGDSHYSVTDWRQSVGRVRPAATQAWVQFDGDDAKYVFFTCKRHAGTTKASITKGSYSGRDVEPAVANVETIAKDVETFLKDISAKAAASTVLRDAQRNAAALERTRTGWVQARADYNAGKAGVAHGAGTVGLSEPTDDPFLRVFVYATGGQLTPTGARAMADRLMQAARTAEDRTAVQEKP